MSVDWWTIALQAINFLVLVWLLQRFLYRPVLGVIARRREQVEQAFADADKSKDAAAATQQRYENAQAQIEQSRQEMLSKAHSEIEADRQQVLGEARTQASSLLEAAREQITAERDAALSNLKGQIADLAVDMAEELLQRVTRHHQGAAPLNVVQNDALISALNDAFLAQMVARLEQMTDEQSLELTQDLATSADGLRVVTATVLGLEQQQCWQDELAKHFSATDVTFLVEPDLIGGAELRFPHARVSLAWSDQLRQGKELLLGDAISH